MGGRYQWQCSPKAAPFQFVAVRRSTAENARRHEAMTQRNSRTGVGDLASVRSVSASQDSGHQDKRLYENRVINQIQQQLATNGGVPTYAPLLTRNQFTVIRMPAPGRDGKNATHQDIQLNGCLHSRNSLNYALDSSVRPSQSSQAADDRKIIQQVAREFALARSGVSSCKLKKSRFRRKGWSGRLGSWKRAR